MTRWAVLPGVSLCAAKDLKDLPAELVICLVCASLTNAGWLAYPVYECVSRLSKDLTVFVCVVIS